MSISNISNFKQWVVMAVVAVATACHGYVDPATLPKPEPKPETPTDGKLTLVADKSSVKVGEQVTFGAYFKGEEPTPTPDPTPGDDQQPLPVGVVHIYADKTTLNADGTDYVEFKVLYGTEEGNLDISTGPTTRLVYTYNGIETKLGYGVCRFSTTTPGTYTIKATAYRGGNLESENQIAIVANDSNATGDRFYHKQLGMQFTSIGCQNCPELSRVIKVVQAAEPERLVAVSFHEDFKVSDPMTLDISTKYHSHLGEDGLPRFFMNMRPGDIGAYQTNIEKAIVEHIENYPPTCGVAISTNFNVDTRSLEIKSSITSTTATAYRYDVMLVEDGIVGEQMGVSGTYTHNNVVRQVLSGSITGSRFNLGSALTPGEEHTEQRTVTIPDAWSVENLRVVVLALTTPDGGESYVVNNCNECKAGESVGYIYDEPSVATSARTLAEAEGVDVTGSTQIRCTTTGETLSSNSFTPSEAGSYDFIATYNGAISNRVSITVEADNPDQPVTPGTGQTMNFERHMAVMEFTGAWCTWCPDGYSLLKLTLETYRYDERAHIIALHDNTSGEDPMGLPLTSTINNDFGPISYPGFVIDLRDAGEIGSNSAGIRDALRRSDNDYPAHCGIALQSDYDESARKGKITAKVYSNSEDIYRITLFILEDNIISPQKSGSTIVENYAHNHVVRKMLSSSYKGDRVGELGVGQEQSVEYDFTLPEQWVAENCSICALIIDGTSTVNNVNVCRLVDGSADYNIEK